MHVLGLLKEWRGIYGGKRAGEVLFSLHCAAWLYAWDCTLLFYASEMKTAPTIFVFFQYCALLIAMSLVKLPRVQDYWYGRAVIGAARMPNFTAVMTLTMFNEITRMLRFAKPADKDDNDRGWKASLSVCLSIWLSICLFIYLSICLSIYSYDLFNVMWPISCSCSYY